MFKVIIIFSLTLLFSGCAPNSFEEYQKEGEAVLKTLLKELEEIETKEELLVAKPFLQKRFDKLGMLLVSARQYQLDHKQEWEKREIFFNEPLNRRVQEQLVRLYQIEGARKVIEESMRGSLLKLDSFEKEVEKKKTSSYKRL